MKIREFIKKHWLALFISICGGILLVMPIITSVLNIGFDNFRGVYPIMNADSYLYEAILGDVWDGHYTTGNAYYIEGKNGYFLNPSLAQIIVSSAGKLFSFSLPFTSFLSDFFLTSILFFLAYYFIYLISLSRKTSLFFLFIYISLFYYFDPVVLSHQFGLVLLYIGLIIIYHLFYAEKGTPSLHIAMGLVIGSLFYVYPFYWTFLLTLYGINILVRYKTYFSKEKIWHIIYFSFIFLITITPYIINSRGAASTGLYGETMLRYGLINTHFPACYFNIFLIAITSLGLFFATRAGKVDNLRFWMVWLISLWVVNWQNVITGIYVQFSSHYYVLTSVMCLILLISVISDIKDNVQKNNKYYSISLLIIFFVLFGILIKKQLPYFNSWINMTLTDTEMLELQPKKDVFDWLNKNTDRESVVYSLDDRMNYLLPIYTHNNVYYSGYGGIFLSSDLSAEKRWVRYNIFNNISEEYILDKNKEIWTNKFVDRYQNYEVKKRLAGYLGIKLPEIENIPKEDILRVKKEYDSVLKDNIAERINDFSVDYILLKKGDIDNAIMKNISLAFPDITCQSISEYYCVYRLK